VDEKSEIPTEIGQARLTRRRFFSWLLGFSMISTLAGVLMPVIGYLWPPVVAARGGEGGRTLVGTVGDFPFSSGEVVPVNDEPAIIVNSEVGGIKAYSAICTHLGCVVYWHEQRQVVQCPCHDGRFNPLNGAVISGPPPRPLPSYELKIVNGEVYIG